MFLIQKSLIFMIFFSFLCAYRLKQAVYIQYKNIFLIDILHNLKRFSQHLFMSKTKHI